MAVALRERRAIRGVEAVAERPDGTRRNFLPYPTPLLDGDGKLVGAVNMLIDVTDRNQARALRAQAVKCRRLAAAISDHQTTNTLNSMAVEYEEQALKLERSN
jgi:PAS domain-containing protein